MSEEDFFKARELLQFGGRTAWVTALAGETPYQEAVDVVGSFRLVNGASGIILGTSGCNIDMSLYELHFNFENGSLPGINRKGGTAAHSGRCRAGGTAV